MTDFRYQQLLEELRASTASLRDYLGSFDGRVDPELRAVLSGYLESVDAVANYSPEPEYTDLTPREIEILRLSEKVMTRQQMADELDVSEKTIMTHLDNIYKKLGISGSNSLMKLGFYSRDHPNLMVRPKYKEENGFSGREMEVFQYLVHGYTDKEIGNMLGISQSTAKNHLYNIYKKLDIGLNGNIGAVLWYRNNIASPLAIEVDQKKPLTMMEIEVLECFSQGLDTQQTATKLGISNNTVKSHSYSLYKKLSIGNFSNPKILAINWFLNEKAREELQSLDYTRVPAPIDG